MNIWKDAAEGASPPVGLMLVPAEAVVPDVRDALIAADVVAADVVPDADVVSDAVISVDVVPDGKE